MFTPTNLGFIVVGISALGYASNWLNWRFLNNSVTRLSYYLGAFVHETSHAIFCVLTRAPIQEYAVLTSQPHVTYGPSRIPFVGPLLINIGPIIGGLTLLYFANRFAFAGHFTLPSYAGWQDVLPGAWQLVTQVNLAEWQGWALILLFLNAGAMLGPSTQDLKNVWFLVLLLCFVNAPVIASVGLLAASLIVVNFIIQIIAISFLGVLRLARRSF